MEPVENIITEFECPICTKYMLPPIKQCINGHTFCHNCFGKIQRCALCKAPKSDHRCIVLEKIQSHLTFPCAYVDQGCVFQSTGDQLAIHQKQCEFSFVPCPLRFNDCEWRGEKSTLATHCKAKHPQNTFFSNSQRLTTSGFENLIDRVYHIIFCVFDTTFRCTWDLDKKTRMMRIAVYILGSAAVGNRFSFELSYLFKDSDMKVISIKHPCYSMDDDSERFLKNKYITLSYEPIRNLCDDDGHLNYIVTISDNNQYLT